MLLVILNPIAGHGRALALEKDVREILKVHGVDHRMARTERAGHATELAREAVAQNLSGVVCVGGDGTLFEVVNGLVGSNLTLYLVACGTGNDFARVLPISRDPLTALTQQLRGVETRVDAATVNGIAFANVSGTGFDVQVLREVLRRNAKSSGLMPYLLGVLSAIQHFRPIEARLSLDGRPAQRRMTIISIANGQYIGGGMRVAPTADVRDGMFEVVSVRAIRRWLIWALLPLFVLGWHIHLPLATVERCREVTVECSDMWLNVDGEIMQVDRAAFSMLPGALRMSLPAKRN